MSDQLILKKFNGPHSSYNEEVGDHVCAAIVEGATLREIAEELNINRCTILSWVHQNEDFAKKYRIARQMQAECLVDDIMTIANDGTNDYMERETKTGGTEMVINSEHIQRSRLRIDSIKWVAGKFAPRVYGDRVDVNHTGGVTATLLIVDGPPADKS